MNDRALAIGIYVSCYYTGGAVGAAVPSALWTAGGWPACVAFIIGVQLTMLTIVWRYWTPAAHENADFGFQSAD